MNWDSKDVITLISVIFTGSLGIAAFLWNIFALRFQAERQHVLKEKEILLGRKLELYSQFVPIDITAHFDGNTISSISEHIALVFNQIMLIATPKTINAQLIFISKLAVLEDIPVAERLAFLRREIDSAFTEISFCLREEIEAMTGNVHNDLRRLHPELFRTNAFAAFRELVTRNRDTDG